MTDGLLGRGFLNMVPFAEQLALGQFGFVPSFGRGCEYLAYVERLLGPIYMVNLQSLARLTLGAFSPQLYYCFFSTAMVSLKHIFGHAFVVAGTAVACVRKTRSEVASTARSLGHGDRR